MAGEAMRLTIVSAGRLVTTKTGACKVGSSPHGPIPRSAMRRPMISAPMVLKVVDLEVLGLGERPTVEHPLVQLLAAAPHWRLWAYIGARDVAVQRDAQLQQDLRHGPPLFPAGSVPPIAELRLGPRMGSPGLWIRGDRPGRGSGARPERGCRQGCSARSAGRVPRCRRASGSGRRPGNHRRSSPRLA
jgi:hypothetical protein